MLASDTVSSKAHTVDCNLAQSFSSCCFVSSNLHNYTQECLLVITCMRLFSKYYNCQLPAILGYCMLLAIDSGLATPHLQLMSIKKLPFVLRLETLVFLLIILFHQYLQFLHAQNLESILEPCIAFTSTQKYSFQDTSLGQPSSIDCI